MAVMHFHLDLHPESKDGKPNAWRASGWSDGNPIPFAVGYGDTAAKALREAEQNRHAEPAALAPTLPPWRRARAKISEGGMADA